MRIGLEVHVQLPTRSKLFCPCPTSAEEPNSAVCPTCLGMPGSRPSMNRAAMEMGLLLAKMLGCQIPERTWFSRKTYFYPDLAKHFQITQYDTPVGEHGLYKFQGKDIRIRRVHLEEDPGKIKRVGRSGEESSLIDYNRSGIPLVEIVTEPDISSPAEARQFLSDLLTEIRHVIDLPDDGERSVRADCNISVGHERVEVKNVTGLKNVERALTFEAVRQTKLLRAGKKVERETRRFDEERKVTLAARKKEFEEDYGYIGEPDLGIFNIGDMARALALKETPLQTAERFQREYGLNAQMSRQLVQTSMGLAGLFEHMAASIPVADVLPWITGTISSLWSELEKLDEEMRDAMTEIVASFSRGEMNDQECQMRLRSLMTGEELTLLQSGAEELEGSINDYLDRNPGVMDDYRKNEKSANRVIGEVMKASGGKYSSSQVVESVRKAMESRR